MPRGVSRRVAANVAAAVPLAVLPAAASGETQTAVFAGGCFWCMEQPFDELDGVLSTTAGYTGGHTPSPTYQQVTYGDTGHLEAVAVAYDPSKIGFAALLAVYWRNIDPFDNAGQFCDKGSSYRAAVFVGNDAERELAQATKDAHQERLGNPFVTRILPKSEFYPAEDYHQDYYRKNPVRYRFYRLSCGRDSRLAEVWGEGATGDH